MPLLNEAKAVYLGDRPAQAIYLGDTLVWPSIPASEWDPATQAFLDASGLDESFAPALDLLVTGLKSSGLWTKMDAVYPFIGGTADLHKWNLIDPRDADDAFRLTFNVGGAPGGHSVAQGYLPNSVTGDNWGYAETYLVPSNVMTQSSTHLSLYSLVSRGWAPRCDMGAYNWDGSMNRFHVIAYYTSGEFYYSMASRATPAVASGESTGLFVATRTTATDMAGYRNGVLLASTVDAVTELPNVSMHIGHLTGYNREFSDLAFGFASIGSGLSEAENKALYNTVQIYQTALDRQIGNPMYPEVPWTPTDITGLTFWTDASQLLLLEGEAVTTWPNLAGGPSVAIRPGVDNPPHFVHDSSNRPVVRFNSALTEFLFTFDSIGNIGEVFVVCKFDAATFPEYNGALTGQYEIIVIGEAGTNMVYPPGHNPTYYRNGVNSTNTRLGPMGVLADMGISVTDTFLGIAPIVGWDRYTTNRNWLGDIAEIITYDHALTTEERDTVNQYLISKWGLDQGGYW